MRRTQLGGERLHLAVEVGEDGSNTRGGAAALDDRASKDAGSSGENERRDSEETHGCKLRRECVGGCEDWEAGVSDWGVQKQWKGFLYL